MVGVKGAIKEETGELRANLISRSKAMMKLSRAVLVLVDK